MAPSTKLTLLVAAVAGLLTAASAKEKAPNILYIYTDDQSFRTVSCYPGAYNYAHTPNIDKDFDELNNLALSPEYKDRVAEMRVKLDDYLKKTGGELFVDLLPEPKSPEDYGKPSSGAAAPTVKLPADTTMYYVDGKKRVHLKNCPRLPDDLSTYKTMSFAEAEAKGLPPCSRCPVDALAIKEKPEPVAKPAGDTPVFHVEGKNRSHVDACKRLSKDPEDRAKMNKMTLAEAEAKGLPLCSRCPGSSTPGKGSPPK